MPPTVPANADAATPSSGLTIAVGVCTYNGGPRIERTLRALAALYRLDGRLTSIVIVDNRSTDDTAAIVDRFAREHPGLPLRRIYEPTPGKIAALRRFFRETDEPLAALTDDDCVPGPAWAAAMFRVFESGPRVGVVGGPVCNVWEHGPTKLATIYRQSLGDHQPEATRRCLDGPREFVIGASMAVRRAALEATGWLDHCFLEARTGSKLECGAEDAEVCIRIRQAGWEIWHEPAAGVQHFIPAARQTTEYLARIRGAICRGEPKIRWLAEGRPASPWADEHARRAHRLWLKTLLTDWRPTRRRIRLAERAGRLEGWRALKEELDRGPTAPPGAVAAEVKPVAGVRSSSSPTAPTERPARV